MVSRFGAVLALLGALGTGCNVAGEWGPLMSSLEATFPDPSVERAWAEV